MTEFEPSPGTADEVATWVSTATATMGCLWLAAALVLYSDAAAPFLTGPWFLLWMSGLFLIPVTIAGVIVVTIGQRKRGQGWKWFAIATPALVLTVWFVAVSLQLPFQVRLRLSEDELRAFALSHNEGDRDYQFDRQIGLFRVQEYDVVGGCTRFITADDFLDDAGVVYCPGGNRPPFVGEDRYEHLYADWWHWWRSW